MKNVKMAFAAVVSAAVFSMVPTAFAQQSGLVNVDIRNVANNIAKNINVDVSQIPVTVQAPIGVAATVCNVAANVLGEQAGAGGGSCTAETTSTALDQIVQQQIKRTGQQ
jgi:hypothetical protein